MPLSHLLIPGSLHSVCLLARPLASGLMNNTYTPPPILWMTTFFLQYFNALINSSVVVSTPDYLDIVHKLFGLQGRFWRSHFQAGSDCSQWLRCKTTSSGRCPNRLLKWKHHAQSPLHNQALTHSMVGVSSFSGFQVKSQTLILSQGEKSDSEEICCGSQGELSGTSGNPGHSVDPKPWGDTTDCRFVLIALFVGLKRF